MRNMKRLIFIFLSVAILGEWCSETVFAQVQGNSVTSGARVGAANAGRGTSLMSRFNRYSVGADQVTMPVLRTTRDPLLVRTRANVRSPMSGSSNVRNPRPLALRMNTGLIRPARPMNYGILRPARPSTFKHNSMRSTGSARRGMASVPRSRMFATKRKSNSLLPIRNNTKTPSAVRPQNPRRPQLQQWQSQTKSPNAKRTIAQHETLIHGTLTSQKMQLFQNSTLFGAARQRRNQERARGDVFNTR